MKNINVKAGRKAYAIIKDGGFSLDSVGAYFAPASGPRWLVASGFDLALIKNKSLRQKKLVWLIGASSGVWRLAAWLLPQPEVCYDRLIDAYTSISCTRSDTAATLYMSMVEAINAYVEEDAISFALSHDTYRFACLTARAKHLFAFDTPLVQKPLLKIASLLNAWDKNVVHRFFERTVFFLAGQGRRNFVFKNRLEENSFI